MDFQNINIKNLNEYIGRNDVIIIDIRVKREYLKGHIPKSINIPLTINSSLGEIEEHILNSCQDKMVILYCARGNVSLIVARRLYEEGYNIKSLWGGINYYRGDLI